LLDRGEMKYAYVDMDTLQPNDHVEWATARYHAHYSPLTAFELELQWLVATGCVLGELVRTGLN
jgi:hypothetical protein